MEGGCGSQGASPGTSIRLMTAFWYLDKRKKKLGSDLAHPLCEGHRGWGGKSYAQRLNIEGVSPKRWKGKTKCDPPAPTELGIHSFHKLPHPSELPLLGAQHLLQWSSRGRVLWSQRAGSARDFIEVRLPLRRVHSKKPLQNPIKVCPKPSPLPPKALKLNSCASWSVMNRSSRTMYLELYGAFMELLMKRFGASEGPKVSGGVSGFARGSGDAFKGHHGVSLSART